MIIKIYQLVFCEIWHFGKLTAILNILIMILPRVNLDKVLNHLPALILVLCLVFFGLAINNLTLNKAEANSKNILSSLADAKTLEVKNIKSTTKTDNILEKSALSKLKIINFFSSWCSSCLAEHKILLKLKHETEDKVEIYGIAWRDLPENSNKFILQNQNPYDKILIDGKNLIGKSFAIEGVPETFIIDENGKILYRHSKELDYEQLILILKIIRQGS